MNFLRCHAHHEFGGSEELKEFIKRKIEQQITTLTRDEQRIFDDPYFLYTAYTRFFEKNKESGITDFKEDMPRAALRLGIL